MVPEEYLGHGKIHLDECCESMSPAELRELWQEIKNSPDMTFVTVEEDDQSVRVWKEAGYLKVHVLEQDKNEKVDVQVPLAVVDALLSGEGEELNIEAAIRALVEEGSGELVTVSGDDETVRVWVDDIAEAE
jgi:flavin-dependent dehydrogenase